MKTLPEDQCPDASRRSKDCVSFERENYYFAKMLTVRSLQSEQNYLNEKRWLINRYGIGWGVLCGLKVVPHPENLCSVVIEPGLALDNYGNEIHVCEPREVNLKEACAAQPNHVKKGAEVSSQTLCISIRYKECPSEPSPMPIEDCGTLGTECVYNRTKETYEIKVSCGEPEPENFWPEADCLHFLRNPGALVVEKCPSRRKCAEIILACICYTEGKPLREYDIDNIRFRKLAFSNDILFELVRCLTKEAWEAKGARYDRRRHIPLLAHTIKGLTYEDGKIACISAGAGIHPHRITSDGDVIWVTDLAGSDLIRIARKTNKPIDPVNLKWPDERIESSWGIAFDGMYMWITHNNDGKGKLTRINTCDVHDRWTFDSLPSCDALGDCQKYCGERDEGLQDIPPYPQEVVYHDKLLYVSHGWSPQYSGRHLTKDAKLAEEWLVDAPVLLISIIDTERCCLLMTVPIKSEDYPIPVTPIVSMVSDGDALWVTYKAVNHYKKERPVIRFLKYLSSDGKYDGKYEIGPPCEIKNGTEPEKIAFDGTYLWITHDAGASKLNGYAGDVLRSIDTEQEQTAIAYGGGDNIWTVELNAGSESGEAQINRIDIHSATRSGEIEFMTYRNKQGADYRITDAQFDGSFIYVSAWYSDSATGKKGIIYRILP